MKADYEAAVAADSPVGWWRLDETSGTTATNSGSAGSSNGTYTNGPALNQTGPVSDCPAVTFDGTNDFVALLDSAPFRPGTGAFTLECWANPANASQHRWLFGKSAPAANIWAFGFGSDPNFGTSTKQFWAYLQQSASSARGKTTPANICDGNWHHFAAVFGGSGAGTIDLYVDGALAASTMTTNVGAWPNYTATSAPAIASVSGGGANRFDRSISQVAYYGGALSAARITAHVDAMLYASTPDDPDCDFFDTFTRSNQNLEASADWLLLSGNIDVVSLSAVTIQQAVNNVARTAATFGLNHRVRAALDWTDPIALHGIVARMSGTTSANYAGYFFRYTRAAARYELYRWTGGNGGTPTFFASFAATEPTSPFVLELRAVGKRGGSAVDLEALADGTRIFCHTDLTPLTGESVGLISANTGDYYDDFCASEWLFPPCGPRSGWHVGDVAIG